MNADRLLAHYERIADAPDAIARLRRFILDLAVRGKLVPQDQKDEPASDLLKRIAKEKARLVKAGDIRAAKPLPDIEFSELPFQSPEGWQWARLGNLTNILQGFAFSSEVFSSDRDVGLPLIKIGDIGSNNPQVFIRGRYDPTYVVNRGDLILGLSGSIKCAVWEGPSALLNQRIAKIAAVSGGLDANWLLLCVDASIEKWKRETSKLTVQNVKAGQLFEAVIPVPPLAEQHRIVAKVDELMVLCDRLEAARVEREVTRDRLAASSLARLNAPDPETFQDDARFVLNVLPVLTTRTDQIKQLRQTILSLAVRGRLVPQDPKDEPASELLKRIAKEKARAGKREKLEAEIDNEEELGELPQIWRTVPLIALGSWAIGSGFPKNEQGLESGPHFFLKVSDMNLPGNEKYITTSNNFIDDDAARRMRAKIHPPGTIIFPKIGGAIATNKRRILTKGSAIDNNCLGITFASELNVEWAFLLLTTLDFTRYQAGTAVPALQQGVLERIPVGLPPLAEQHRIVAKVDALMALCDRLEASLTAAAATRRRLLDALLAEALMPTLDALEAA